MNLRRARFGTGRSRHHAGSLLSYYIIFQNFVVHDCSSSSFCLIIVIEALLQGIPLLSTHSLTHSHQSVRNLSACKALEGKVPVVYVRTTGFLQKPLKAKMRSYCAATSARDSCPNSTTPSSRTLTDQTIRSSD